MNLAQSLNIEAEFETSYLVSCLRNHRDAHRKDYEEAWKNYLIVRAEKAKSLAKVATKLSNNPETELTTGVISSVGDAYNSLITLTKPVNATEMYNQYITLLEASTSGTVTMDVNDANAIINDKWKWAQDAKFSNSFYSNFKG